MYLYTFVSCDTVNKYTYIHIYRFTSGFPYLREVTEGRTEKRKNFYIAFDSLGHIVTR